MSSNSAGFGRDGGYGFGWWGSFSGGQGGDGGSGGGVFNGTNNASASVRSSLIALNSSGTNGLGGAGSGGPILVTVPPPTPSTPPHGPDGTIGSGPDLSGNFSSQGCNLVGIADGSSGFINLFNSDLVGTLVAPVDPLLGPLQNNGGPTLTHALLSGSPAIDQGRSFGVTTDQRGHPRPYDFSPIANATGGDGTDIGAFELDATMP